MHAPLLDEITSLLAGPGLFVLAGGPGCGRSSALAAVSSGSGRPVLAGGGLAILCNAPALALTRAVRAKLPADDPALLAEAVLSRVRGGLLVLDDLQWADAVTLAALPLVAAKVPVLAAVRTPYRSAAIDELRACASVWAELPPLSDEDAAALALRTVPSLSPAQVASVVARSGGVPLVVTALAGSPGRTAPGDASFLIAEALADLTRPARTALAALGLLGRPANAELVASGLAELLAAGLVRQDGDAVRAVSPFVAEVAAGVLDAGERCALHRRLAELTPPLEAARHLAAAGDREPAAELALAAASGEESAAGRAEALLLAASLSDDPAVACEAARAALAAGRPEEALRVAPEHAVAVRAEALLQSGRPGEALAVLDGTASWSEVPADELAAPDADPDVLRVRLLALLAADPAAAVVLASGLDDPPADPGLRVAHAAVAARERAAGWEYKLASAAGAADPLAARWAAWLLVEALIADGRLEEAVSSARAAAEACAVQLAYSWQARFVAAELWCCALRGERLDEVARRAVELSDRTLPEVARGYAVAAAALAEADAGLTRAARARLVPAAPSPADWVAAEAAWLDGQPQPVPEGTEDGGLLGGLRFITARWASLDGAGPVPAVPVSALAAVSETAAGWAGETERFSTAAQAWRGLAAREEIRALLACGLLAHDPGVAVPALTAAEELAESSGMIVLAGRARMGLRRHAVRRDRRGPQRDGELTDRERQILELVAGGEPTRRIAGVLGISRETVETHIRAGMRKLGARTRTEAAARCVEAP
ncbi:helix-turn-helix transcriptional regulator [Longispora albida]|uniref:helix-turn-helix transcriptional regulator n=1 Tax=Longispora albida TaxID=203523 RepID=UPI00036E4379|nr:LuxR family transcriptional regulator [Longispora albida]